MGGVSKRKYVPRRRSSPGLEHPILVGRDRPGVPISRPGEPSGVRMRRTPSVSPGLSTPGLLPQECSQRRGFWLVGRYGPPSGGQDRPISLPPLPLQNPENSPPPQILLLPFPIPSSCFLLFPSSFSFPPSFFFLLSFSLLLPSSSFLSASFVCKT